MRYIVIILWSVIHCVSCKKPCDLPDQQIGNGIILKNAQVIRLDPGVITWEMRTTFRIDSEEENLLDFRVIWDGGTVKDSIDFSNYTVLGAYARGGCQVIYDRLVLCNPSEQKCLYNVDVVECGDCGSNSESLNMVLVPKIDPSYAVDFAIQ